MANWPFSIPFDLRVRLEAKMRQRSYGAADLWGEMKEWLEKHGVEAPDGLPDDRPPDGSW